MVERILDGLDGLGAYLHLPTQPEWRKLLYLSLVDGDSIYVLLVVGYRKRHGAVLKGFDESAP